MKPKTKLTIAAASEVPNVTRYEARTRGFVTSSQKRAHVSVAVLKKSADKGISTIRHRYNSVYPRLRPNPGRTLRCLKATSRINSHTQDERYSCDTGVPPVQAT